jgi:hypothetical protein
MSYSPGRTPRMQAAIHDVASIKMPSVTDVSEQRADQLKHLLEVIAPANTIRNFADTIRVGVAA